MTVPPVLVYCPFRGRSLGGITVQLGCGLFFGSRR